MQPDKRGAFARGLDVLFQFLTAAVMVCFFGALVGLGGSLATAEPAGWRAMAFT